MLLWLLVRSGRDPILTACSDGPATIVELDLLSGQTCDPTVRVLGFRSSCDSLREIENSQRIGIIFSTESRQQRDVRTFDGLEADVSARRADAARRQGIGWSECSAGLLARALGYCIVGTLAVLGVL